MRVDGCVPPVNDQCTHPGKHVRYSPTKCCPPNVIADGNTCTAANGVTTMKQCLEAVCGKTDSVEFGQCQAYECGVYRKRAG